MSEEIDRHVLRKCASEMGIPKCRGPVLGVLFLRIIVFWAILGSPYFEKLPNVHGKCLWTLSGVTQGSGVLHMRAVLKGMWVGGLGVVGVSRLGKRTNG